MASSSDLLFAHHHADNVDTVGFHREGRILLVRVTSSATIHEVSQVFDKHRYFGVEFYWDTRFIATGQYNPGSCYAVFPSRELAETCFYDKVLNGQQLHGRQIQILRYRPQEPSHNCQEHGLSTQKFPSHPSQEHGVLQNSQPQIQKASTREALAEYERNVLVAAANESVPRFGVPGPLNAPEMYAYGRQQRAALANVAPRNFPPRGPKPFTEEVMETGKPTLAIQNLSRPRLVRPSRPAPALNPAYKVLRDFFNQTHSELSVNEGDIVISKNESDEDWVSNCHRISDS